MDLLLFSNLYIALAAALMALQTDGLMGTPARLDGLVATAFFGTLLVYNLDRLIGARSEDRVEATRRHRWVRTHRRLLRWVTVAAALGLGASMATLSLPVILWLALLAVLCAAYCLPLMRPLPGPFDRLKEVVGLKVFLIAAVWAAATAWLPAVETGMAHAEPATAAMITLRRFLFIAAITLPFDVRDLSRDAAAGVRTVPMWLGTAGTRRLALVLLAAFVVLSPIRVGSEPGHGLALILSAVPTAALLLALTPTRGDLYYSLGLDGTMIIQSALVLMV